MNQRQLTERQKKPGVSKFCVRYRCKVTWDWANSVNLCPARKKWIHLFFSRMQKIFGTFFSFISCTEQIQSFVQKLNHFFSCVCVGIGLFSRFMWISNEVAKSNPWFPFLFAAFFSPYSFFHIFSWIIRTYQTVEGRKKREKKKKLSPTTSKAAKQFQQE